MNKKYLFMVERIMMNNLDKHRFLLGTIVTLFLAITGNTAIIFIYFIIIFVQELLYMLRYQNEKIIQQILMLIPLMGITVINGIPLGNIYIAVFASYLLFVYKDIGMKKNKFLPYIVFVFTDIFRLFVFYGEGFDVVGIISVPILYLCIFAGMAAFEKTNKEEIVHLYIPAFIEGVILSILYGAIIRFKSGGLNNVLMNTNIVDRNEGASGDPNYFGLYICLAVSMIILLMMMEEKYSITYFLGACVLIVMGLSSSSRMFFVISMFLIGILVLILVRNIFNQKIMTTIMLIAILSVGLYFIQDILVDNLDYVFSRLNTSDISELTNGRSDLIKLYFSYIEENPFRMLFGIGIAQYNIRSGIGAYAHNMYLELYVARGIIGIFIVTFIIIRNIFKGNWENIEIYQYIPISIVALSGLAINVWEVDCFYMLWGLLFSFISIKKRRE